MSYILVRNNPQTHKCITVMKLEKLTNKTFHRIGDEYAPYIDHDHFLGRNPFDELNSSQPRMNIRNYKHAGHLEVALPGFKKEEIHLFVENNTLLISAKKEGYKHAIDDEFLQKEYNPDFQLRYYYLTKEIDQDHITSAYIDGILHVNLPKREPKLLTEHRKVLVT